LVELPVAQIMWFIVKFMGPLDCSAKVPVSDLGHTMMNDLRANTVSTCTLKQRLARGAGVKGFPQVTCLMP
jgi:hypothetical protein